MKQYIQIRFDDTRDELTHSGHRDAAASLPINQNTLFPIASVTKTITAELILEAAGRGELDLDRPLQDQLECFELADPDATARMTPHDALCHFSGLAPHTQSWVRCPLSRRDYMKQILPSLPSEGPFRERHRYSNILYAVLGQLLEECSGRSWEEHVQEELIPELPGLGILEAGWENLPQMAQPYRNGERIPPFYARKDHLIAPASELFASAETLMLWGRRFLKDAADHPRWQAQNRVAEQSPLAGAGPLDYGLGWRIDHPAGRKRVWHSGHCSGYRCLLELFPEQREGRFIASNDGAEDPEIHRDAGKQLQG